MITLSNKRILLGISGGIAAYKAAELARGLKSAGAEVRVVMTRAATKFITPLTLQALTANPVHTELLDPKAEAGMGHIELARWPDLMMIAPASASCLARLAGGHGDELLTTVCLALRAPLVVAPAMNEAMWAHAATQANVQSLKNRGVQIWGPDTGAQACGDVGLGRMLEPQDLVDRAHAFFDHGALAGKTVVITAGPTREALDPVRYLSNHSSGKMGYALAEACIEAGAKVVLVSGPTTLMPPEQAHVVHVLSAQDMLDACLAHVANMDIFIATAAVADYRPQVTSEQKIKKLPQEETKILTLVKNPDIVATLACKAPEAYIVGFAAETERVIEYAQSKLERKGLNMIVANDVSNSRIGFNSDNNAVEVLTSTGQESLPECSKPQLARALVVRIAKGISQTLG